MHWLWQESTRCLFTIWSEHNKEYNKYLLPFYTFFLAIQNRSLWKLIKALFIRDKYSSMCSNNDNDELVSRCRQFVMCKPPAETPSHFSNRVVVGYRPVTWLLLRHNGMRDISEFVRIRRPINSLFWHFHNRSDLPRSLVLPWGSTHSIHSWDRY